ncbi:glycerate kinase [Modestobacter sp. VKM Ac-2984]|uniref:glycerate kinase n=1 Tax=Modestobacter sp. VKM Ac-2984 TaxID=3004138 RepID=UPI0022AA621F|nr:glycerate kinase [Modestobacter sp. VKM Ac-2984]MCZ2815391.1 glycerate kinase [Modestobacter sp. VKM Ac-2984]
MTRVVIAPDSFKGTLGAAAAAEALAEGWRRVRPEDELLTVPLADGGEGTLEALGHDLPADCWRSAPVTGPDGRAVDAAWLLLPDGTAVVEMARAAGLPLLERPDPLGATTRGLGQLLAAVVADPAVHRVMLTLGGSATTDGGTGALAALGARFLDADGAELPPGGGALSRLARVDLAGLTPPPAGGVQCLVDVTAPLLGPLGAAGQFGPQKGADPGQVTELDAGLARLADLLGGDREAPGAGAAGGTAYGFAVCWGAESVSGAQAVAAAAGLDDALRGAALVVTGEGQFDAQSLRGKVVGDLVDRAAGAQVPVAVVAGRVAAAEGLPVSRAVSLTELAGSVAAAMAEPAHWLATAGEHLAREQSVST